MRGNGAMTNGMSASHWSLDKRIPVALLLVLIVQLGTGIWFISEINTRVTNLETVIGAQVDTRDRVIRMEVQMDGISGTVKSIDGKVERLIRGERPGL